MPRLKFCATAQHRQYVFKKGGKQEGSYGGKPTLKIVPPVILQDGDEVEANAFEAEWCLKHLPDNFVAVEAKVKKSKSKDAPEPEEES